MQKTKTKNQKPIDIDIHFKYRCPNTDCGYYHWLSLPETKTKNFKVVCDCGQTFKPKKINTIQIVYETNTEPTKEHSSKPEKKDLTVPVALFARCARILGDYGFSKEEIENLLNKSYVGCPTDDALSLVKHVLQNLET
jgi:hypothetical protein